MRKKALVQGCLGLAIFLALTLLVTDLFAEEETFTITTYYPSPYGSYNELQVYRSVTYRPINKDAITDPKEGELVYDSSADKLYLYNGSKWVAQGEGGGGVLTLIGEMGGSAPACPEEWIAVQTGYWNCPIEGVSGSCFCAPDKTYRFKDRKLDGTVTETVYSSKKEGLNQTQYTPCTICVK